MASLQPRASSCTDSLPGHTGWGRVVLNQGLGPVTCRPRCCCEAGRAQPGAGRQCRHCRQCTESALGVSRLSKPSDGFNANAPVSCPGAGTGTGDVAWLAGACPGEGAGTAAAGVGTGAAGAGTVAEGAGTVAAGAGTVAAGAGTVAAGGGGGWGAAGGGA